MRRVACVLASAGLLTVVAACEVSVSSPAAPTEERSNANLARECASVDTLDACERREGMLAARSYDCQKSTSVEWNRKGCDSVGARLQATRARLAELKQQRAQASAPPAMAEQPATSPLATAADSANASASSPPPASSAPLASDEVVTAVVAALSGSPCGAPNRRAIVRAKLTIKTSGTIDRADVVTSSLPRAAMLECFASTVRKATFRSFEMPPGKAGMITVCPNGTEGAGLFSCHSVKADFLTFVTTLGVDADGKVEPVTALPQETLHVITHGQDQVATSADDDGPGVIITAPRTWAPEPATNLPRYCAQTSAPDMDLYPRSEFDGQQGWCFAYACGTEDGHLGLAANGADLCPAPAASRNAAKKGAPAPAAAATPAAATGGGACTCRDGTAGCCGRGCCSHHGGIAK